MTHDSFDFVIIGGGTAGCVIAARLAEMSDAEICLIEAGPSDEQITASRKLGQWQSLLGGPYDYDYRIEPQPRGNGAIRHARGRLLGGSSAHNSAIAFLPPAEDLLRWVAAGASGWGPSDLAPYMDRLRAQVPLERSASGNACVEAFLAAAGEAGHPRADFGAPFREGADWFLLNKRGEERASSASAYLHPLRALPGRLTVETNTVVHRILIEAGRAAGVDTDRGIIRARREIILSAGAFDSPKLLMLSGIGPADELRRFGIPVAADLGAVGAHLLDHPEGVVIWEAAEPVPEATAQRYEAGLFARRDSQADFADVMIHFGTEAFDMQTARLGYPTSENAFSMTPNVTRAKSEGTVRLRSREPIDPPLIDFRYFTDEAGYDERMMVEGIKIAREIAAAPSLARWVARELAPGPDVRSDAEISDYARKTANTVYHPVGTCRMGAEADPQAVVDPALKVRGIAGLRVADASVFPTLTSVNPCLTCMLIGEKCADLILDRDGREKEVRPQ